MPSDMRTKVTLEIQRRVLNPVMKLLPQQTLLETIGRKSGQPRRTPLGGRLLGSEFWFVSEFGTQSNYIRNIQAQPRVRLRLRGRWRSGTAHLLIDDDARARLRTLPQWNSVGVRGFGTQLLTVRVDLDD